MLRDENRYCFSTTVRRRRNISRSTTSKWSSHLSVDGSSHACHEVSRSTERTYDLSCYKNQTEHSNGKMDNNQSDSSMLSRDGCRRRHQLRISTYKRFFPSSSVLKIFLLMYVFILVMQSCESSAKWWSIMHVPSIESLEITTDTSSDTSSKRHYRRSGSQPATINQRKSNSDLYSRLRDINIDEAKNLLSDETIREILSGTDPSTVGNSGSFGGFVRSQITNERYRSRDVIKHVTDDDNNRKSRRRSRFHSNDNAVGSNIGTQTLIDHRIQPLNKKQRRMMRRNPGAMSEIIRGIRRAVRECKFQFRNRRWTCPTDNHDSSLFGKILNNGFPETAFIYAITSAAVSHAVAKGCSEGTIETCGCDDKSGPGGPGWEWGGCSDNLRFGRKFAKEFVDAAEVGRDLKYRMNLHNNEAGRMTVNEKAVRHCKCHGLSGSCTVQTCWLRVGDFHEIGRRLRDKYDSATEVTISNQGSIKEGDDDLIPIHGEKSPKKQDLVYFENSPSFCSRNTQFWVDGTRGRTCNATSNGYNGCDSMCCGRGYRTRQKTVRQRCKCVFQWCCNVKCDVCETVKQVSVCK